VKPYGGDPSVGTEYLEALQETLAIFAPPAEGEEVVEEAVRVDVGEALGQVGDPRLADREFPAIQRRPIRASFEAIVELVAAAFGETAESIRHRSHRPARKALAHLASTEAGLSLVAIGEWMKLTGRAVGHLVQRGTELERDDREYAAALRTIRSRLAADDHEEHER